MRGGIMQYYASMGAPDYLKDALAVVIIAIILSLLLSEA